MHGHELNSNQDSFFEELHKIDIISNLSKYMIQPKRKMIKKILFKTNTYEMFYRAVWLIRHK